MEHLFLFCILIHGFLSLVFYKRLRGKAYIAPLIPLAVAGGQAIYQYFQGEKQKNEAKKAESYVPPSLLQEENMARVQAGATRYAGQDQDETLVRQGTADTFANVSRATTSSGDLLNAASKLDASQSKAFQGIAKTGQIFHQNAMDRLRGTLARKAGAQMQSRMYAENLRGAATQNQYNAAKTLGGGIVQAGLANDWNKTFGQNTNSTMMFNPMSSGMGLNSGRSSGWDPTKSYGWDPIKFLFNQ